MWCPSVSLSVWSNAWMAGHAAPDDVLDALIAWAPRHSVIAYDSVAAGRTGLPWPDVDAVGPMSLLQTVRLAAGGRSVGGAGNWPHRPIGVLMPIAGDVRGLPPGSGFARDALAAGEAMVISPPDGEAIGVVPDFAFDDTDDPDDPGDCTLSWSVYSLPGRPQVEHCELGEAEYALRTAVRSAAEALSDLELAAGGDNPRALVEEVLEATGHHRVPDHAPQRATRVLATAAHVDAIVMVGSGLSPVATHSASEARIAEDALRPLVSVVRSARAAAVAAILDSAWR